MSPVRKLCSTAWSGVPSSSPTRDVMLTEFVHISGLKVPFQTFQTAPTERKSTVGRRPSTASATASNASSTSSNSSDVSPPVTISSAPPSSLSSRSRPCEFGCDQLIHDLVHGHRLRGLPTALSHERGSLPTIATQIDADDLRIELRRFDDLVAGAVGRTVIDQDDLVGLADGTQNLIQRVHSGAMLSSSLNTGTTTDTASRTAGGCTPADVLSTVIAPHSPPQVPGLSVP